jgi:hypothetical protein
MIHDHVIESADWEGRGSKTVVACFQGLSKHLHGKGRENKDELHKRFQVFAAVVVQIMVVWVVAS